jgi:para-nitrobenzyl esterase
MQRHNELIGIVSALTLSLTGSKPAMAASAQNATDPIVKIESGLLQGSRQGGLVVFKGIPYAEPPIGDLRWRPPVAAKPWSGIRPATKFGDDCEQTRRSWDVGRPDAKMSEDCLTLNIWAPLKVPPKGAPVMFWIHGGSFTAGSSAQPVYDGAKLAARGIVIVTINYRVGRFGFFAHPALTREAAGGPVGNYGLMDQLAALQWVQRNIRAFGGNPGSVTIFGESAGGSSVNIFMASPAARGLFHRAISESGGGREEAKSLSEAEVRGKAFAAKAGVTADDPAALRALPADVVRGGAALESDSATFMGPFLDGHIIQGDIDTTFSTGRQAPVPYMAGSNGDEIGFLPPPMRAPATAFFSAQLGADLPGIKTAYGSAQQFEADVMNDAVFAEPARNLARSAKANGAYLYKFDYVAEAERTTLKGAPHAYEVAFVFGTLETLKSPPSATDIAMAKTVGDYWVAFARTGRPAPSGHPAWPSIGAGKSDMMIFSSAGALPGNSESAALDALAAHAERKKALAR